MFYGSLHTREVAITSDVTIVKRKKNKPKKDQDMLTVINFWDLNIRGSKNCLIRL